MKPGLLGPKGVLIAEAVIACFLLIFAFLAAASLFDASLRWESSSSNERKAALLAERKMEEIRAAASQVPSGTTFGDHIDSILALAHDSYSDAPGFDFEVVVLPNHHEPIPTSGFTPEDGVHSPCSQMYTEPSNPGSTSRTSGAPAYDIDPASAFNLAGDFQKNERYDTYPYSRSMPNSFRLVRVRVLFGSGGNRMAELISLIGDPILPPNKPTTNVNDTLRVTPTGGVNIGLNGSQVFGTTVTTANGSIVEDVSCLWSIHPISSGTADLYVLNAGGTQVLVRARTAASGYHNGLSQGGTNFVLFPQIRYEGIEARALSGDVNL
ncbi:MAG: hypothetical protein WC314_19035 [Vulcanimicrobiota bacterium]